MPIQLYAPGTRKGNKFWLARVSVNGRRAEVSSGTTDQAAAQRWAREFAHKLALEDRTPRPGEAVSFAYAAEKYLAYRRDPGRAETIRGARLVARSRKIAGKSRRPIWSTPRRSIPPGPGDLNRQRCAARHPALSRAALGAWLRGAPVQGTNPVPARCRWSGDGADRQRHGPDLTVSYCGCSARAIVSLGCAAVEWTKSTSRRHGRDADRRPRVGDPDLHWELVALLGNVENKAGRVFRWETKSGVYKPLRALCKRIGVHMTPHMARHSMATWLVQDGVTTATIMEAGGWKDVKSVLRYGRANLAEVRAARGGLPALDKAR